MGIQSTSYGQVTYVVKTGNNTVRRIFGENLNNNFANLELHSSHKRLLNGIIVWGEVLQITVKTRAPASSNPELDQEV